MDTATKLRPDEFVLTGAWVVPEQGRLRVGIGRQLFVLLFIASGAVGVVGAARSIFVAQHHGWRRMASLAVAGGCIGSWLNFL